MERRLAAVLIADVVGYGRLSQVDEEGTRARFQADLKEIFEPKVAAHRGRLIKTMGDGLLVEFSSVVDALRCAVEAQAEKAKRNADTPSGQRLDFRIGVNLGDIIVEGDDIHGDGVNIADRIQALAEPGGVAISGAAYDQVKAKLPVGYASLGEQRVKSIAEPVRVYRILMDPAAAGKTVTAPRPRAWRLPAAAAIILLLALAVAAFGWYAYLRPSPSANAVASTVPAIAVLPFDDMSGDPALGYMGDGIAEDIIATLSRFPDLSVIARNSSFAYKGRHEDVRKIGKELGVDYVLEGSVRKGHRDMRIVAQLIDTSDGKHVWADRFDKSSADPLVLQDQVTTQIVDTLVGANGQIRKADYQRVWGKDTVDLEEYDYYLRGQDYFSNITKKDYIKAADIWREGLTRFPESSLLKAKLGLYHFFFAFDYFSDDLDTDYQRAGELGREVLSMKPLTPQVARLAHLLMAYVYLQERDFPQAIAESEEAKALAPYDAGVAGLLATVLIMSGRPDQGIDWTEAALSKNPASRPHMNYRLGLAYSLKGDDARSIEALRNAPEWPDMLLLRAIGYLRLGRIAEAEAAYKKALTANPSFTQSTWRQGYFYSDPSIVKGQIADLAKLGLPEE